MPGSHKKKDKKTIKPKPKHPRPARGIRWSEKKEEKPSYKKKKKREKEIKKDRLSQ
jgi:hypothetical protein